jgi:hypothetical protein
MPGLEGVLGEGPGPIAFPVLGRKFLEIEEM